MAAKTTTDPTLRPAPRPSDLTAAFWAATTEGRFLIQRCTRCQAAIFYPRVNCTECGSTELVNEDASGRGTVYTYTVARRPTHRAWADAGPYVIAIVELEEGPHVTTNIVECDPDDVRIGMPVEVCFAPEADGVALPLFRPSAS
ncbi:MAG: Zn-ribbon domain-containing OB-fold protein [Acidimicrobiia bacterium]|nr:Zn-ribbon domain-containing OB-fold protein [Acidimicrobiia bacterium]MDH4362654.1 Zn-ribbon domain-containing OB-fold protein [Acidimicrobiia bacterium]MDH5288366.1 Zn-ribbon domain-containing OB-fold protein [Acidimicrobiia bacterium]